MKHHYLTMVAAIALTGHAMGGERGEVEHGLVETCEAGKVTWARQAAEAYDAETGLDLRNFPRDRVVDFEHMLLRMRFEDLDAQRFEATSTLRFSPIGAATEALTLDAVGLDIHAVTLAGDAVEHFADDETLTLRFDPPLAPGRSYEVSVEYVCDHPSAGMTFTPSSTEAPDYTAEVHTQGQTETNRHWFPCHDFPNERMSTELIVDVPAGQSVSANGRLISKSDRDGRSVWHYLQAKPHVSYLVSLVIGSFDIVEIDHDRVPMKVWVPRGLGDQVEQTYGRTGAMIDLLEARLGVAYPWDRYDQLCVKNFNAGGMENTSVTSMYPTAILDKTALLDGDLDGLIAHELAHQWTGDMITCKSWAHIWLNEGWATYGAALWFEARDGEDGYLDSIRRSFRVARRDKTTNDTPMVSPVYEEAWEVFGRAANPYPKGSSILHMLRTMLGDEVFFRGVKTYMERFALKEVETNDFRYVMEEVSGRGLEWFFEQWCYRPGSPRVTATVEFDASSRELVVEIEQTQEMTDRTPAMRFELPIYVRTAGGAVTDTIDVREKTATFRATLDGPPEIVAIDPWLAVLKVLTVEKPKRLWINQVRTGPTIAARHTALEALRDYDDPDTVRLVGDLAADASIRHTLRNTAIETLAGYGSAAARERLLTLLDEGVEDARVRVQLIRKLNDADVDKAGPRLADLAGNDPSYACRSAAISGLAQHELEEHADLIVELVRFPSQHNQVRSAALRALGDFDDERGLGLAMEYAGYGNTDRSRPTAVTIVGKLAEHDKEQAFELLMRLLDDPEQRTIRAAGAALAKLGDERALDALEAMERSHPSRRLRQQAKRWVKTLREKDEKTGDGERPSPH